MSLKDVILSGDRNQLTQYIKNHPESLHQPVIWGGDNTIQTELIYFVVGLPFHKLLECEKATMILEELLTHISDVTPRNTNGETPLHGSVSYGEVEMSRLLITAGADLEADGGVIENGTPLLLAVFFGMLECARLLVEHGATVTDLAIPAGMGDTATLTALLKDRQFDQEQLQRAFAFACINGQQVTATILLQKGADINAIAYRDLNGLHWTAYRNQSRMAEFLLQQGADPTIRDPNYDSTPLGWAIYHGQTDVQQVLQNYQPKDKV